MKSKTSKLFVVVIIIACCQLLITSLHANNRKIDSLLNILNTSKADSSADLSRTEGRGAIKEENKIKTQRFSKTDSLKDLLTTAQADTTRINTLYRLSVALSRIGDYDQALDYANKALTEIRSTNDEVRMTNEKLGWLKKATAEAYNTIGIIYYQQGNYPKALDHYIRSLKLKKKLNDKAGIARTYNNIAVIYRLQGNYSKALDHYIRSLKFARQLKDKPGIANTYNNIAIIYYQQGNYPKALEQYTRSLKLKRQLNDRAGIAVIYNNFALIYWEQGNYSKALEHYTRSLKLARQLKDKYLIAANYYNIGSLYTMLPDSVLSISSDSTKHLYARAMELQQKSLKITKKMGAAEQMTWALYGIGALYMKQQRYGEAVSYFEQSADIADSIGAKPHMVEAYEKLAICNWQLAVQLAVPTNRDLRYAPIGSLQSANERADLLEKAYKYEVKYANIKEEVFNEEKSKEIGRKEMEYEYELEKIDQAKRRAEAKEARNFRDNVQYSIILAGLVVLFTGVFFLGNFILKNWVINAVTWIPVVLLFEFILVWTDPWVTALTGGQPLYILLFNSSIAILLFPLQHLLQTKLKQRMVKLKKRKVKKKKEIGE